MNTRYRHIEVSGSPRALGHQIGEAARDEIRGFAAIALERVNKTVPISRTRAMDVSRHVNDHPQTGFWASVFSVVIEADQGRMHISRGNPCAAPYETYSLN